LERHYRVRRGQAGVAEDLFDAAFRHPIARYLQPSLCGVGSGISTLFTHIVMLEMCCLQMADTKWNKRIFIGFSGLRKVTGTG